MAIPFYLSGGYVLWKVTRYVDYTSRRQISSFQSEAAKQSLLKTLQTHGWKKMFQYEIPLFKCFPDLYRKAVKDMSLNQLISFYEIAEGYRKETPRASTLVIPKPSEFIDKFVKETEKIPACETFKHYDIPKLHSYRIVSDKFHQAYLEYTKGVEDYSNTCSANDSVFEKKAWIALNKFDNILTFAVGETLSQRNWIYTLKRNMQSLSSRSPFHWDLDESVFQNLKLNKVERVDFVYTAQSEFNKTFRSALAEYKSKQSNAKATFTSLCNRINKHFA